MIYILIFLQYIFGLNILFSKVNGPPLNWNSQSGLSAVIRKSIGVRRRI